MDESMYIKDRLENQIEWYSSKSTWNKKFHNSLQILEICLAVMIPVLAGYAHVHWVVPIIIGVFGAIIAVSEGTSKLYKFHENWLEYRSVSEMLKHEKYLYITRSGLYNAENPFNLLVERVESIISHENISWATMNQQSKDKR